MFLGRLVYLEAKAKGDNSMPGKQQLPGGVQGKGLQDPRDMAKAGLPKTQSPGVKVDTHRNDACNRCCTMLGFGYRTEQPLWC